MVIEQMVEVSPCVQSSGRGNRAVRTKKRFGARDVGCFDGFPFAPAHRRALDGGVLRC